MVSWSTAVYENAQNYVNGLTTLVHSDSYSLAPPAGPAGENLAMGQANLVEAVNGWYDEVSRCNWPGCETGSGPVGHFTAMVWRGVTEIGCATKTSNRIYICRYRSGDSLSLDTANMQGGFEANVPAAIKSKEA